MAVYIDLALLLNFLVDFLLLSGTNRLAGFPPQWRRCLLAAALGGVYGAACLLSGFSFLGNILWRTVCMALMAAVAFGWNRSAWQRSACFLLLTMALGGLASGLRSSSFWALVLAAAGLWLLCRIGFRGGRREHLRVTLQWQGRKMSLIALRDTGNLLRDPLTGEQVLVAGVEVAWELLGLSPEQLAHPVETLASGKVPGLRLIPYRAVGQSGGFLPAVRMRQVQIEGRTVDAVVAFAPDRIAKGEVYQMLAGGAV